jgi:ornithine cyclodeaminase/alanine dehydrogenase-like protein (mu-crystallin family)
MRVISAAEIDIALTFPALITALENAFRGDIITPNRHHHSIARDDADATLLLMPAWTGPAMRPALLGTKVVTVFPGNGAVNLPSVTGTYLLMDGATGLPHAAMDGARITAWRTAAASALAAKYLARSDTNRMLMVGAGALAPFFIKAHASLRPFTDIAVWNRNPAGGARLVAELRQDGLPVRVATDLEVEARQADIISCATLATTPLIHGAWLKPGAHLDMAGAFTLGMREADDEALTRASVFIDTKAALVEGGDVAVAIKTGTYSASQVRGDLFDLCRGTVAGRTSADEITLFKSIGTAIEDLAAAGLVWERLSHS